MRDLTSDEVLWSQASLLFRAQYDVQDTDTGLPSGAEGSMVTSCRVRSASPESRLREVAILVVFLLALAVGVFTYSLGLPFKLFPA